MWGGGAGGENKNIYAAMKSCYVGGSNIPVSSEGLRGFNIERKVAP